MAKIGEGHAAAMLRLGLKELRNAANPSREGIGDSELGLYGTATQQDVNDSRGDGPEALVGATTLAAMREAAEEKSRQAEPERDGPEREPGRGR